MGYCIVCCAGTAAAIPTWTRSARCSTRRRKRRKTSSIWTTDWATCSARWRSFVAEREETVRSIWKPSPASRRKSRNFACSTRRRSANRGRYRLRHLGEIALAAQATPLIAIHGSVAWSVCRLSVCYIRAPCFNRSISLDGIGQAHYAV